MLKLRTIAMPDILAYSIFFAPVLLVLIAWIRVFNRSPRPAWISLASLLIVSANSVFAAVLFLHSRIQPASLPPWKDPVNLDAALLLLFAPFGMLVGLFAGIYRGPAWLIWLVETASIPLLLIGFGAALSLARGFS